VRRPGFLSILDAQQYQKVYQNLFNRHYALPNPVALSNELQVIGSRLKGLCNFTIWIADPTWRADGNASKEAALWTYAQLIGDLYNPLPVVQDPNGEDIPGAVDEDEFKRRSLENIKKGEAFTQQLRKHIISNVKLYSSIPQVCPFDPSIN
jgi:hypothetical protein